MKSTTDKTVEVLKEQFDKLGEVETSSNKRDIRQLRRRLKQQMHKRERNLSKRELAKQLTPETD